MVPSRIKVSLFLIPAIVIGLFETLRHTLLENILPTELGNWVTACIDAGVIALVARKLFLAYAKKEQELSQEKASRAVLEERERLARVLHDQIAQSIFYAGVQVTAAKTMCLDHADKTLAHNLNDVLLSLREIDENVRQAIFNLKHNTMEGANLEDRIRTFLEKTLSGNDIAWDFQVAHSVGQLSPAEQVQLFGILQESITNVVKHARATQVTVTFSADEENSGHWSFMIQDNGIGFNTDAVRDGRYGLDIIASRARDIAATLTIQSRHGDTRLHIRR